MDPASDDLCAWLSTHKLGAYQQALQEEGYDFLQSLTLLSEAEVEELSTEIVKMKSGHQRIFKKKVREAREEEEEQQEERKRARDHRKLEEQTEDKLAVINANQKLADAEARGTTDVPVDKKEHEGEENATSDTKHISLPPGKKFAYFASHKKSHTRFGESSADLARASKDVIKLKYGLDGYFDVDNLQKVSKQSILEGIVQSCSILLFLNDETLLSEWCIYEINEARQHGIPIICVVDTDKQPTKEVIDRFINDYPWLFHDQVISFSTQSRDHTYALIFASIKRGIEYCQTQDTLKRAVEEQQPKAGRVHEIYDESQMELVVALRSKCGTTKAAFDSFSNDEGTIGKREWRSIIKKLLPDVSKAEAKALRKKLPKKVTLEQFCELMTESKQASASKHPSSHLAELPGDVPVLPNSFKSRPHAQEQLVAALLDSGGNRSTAVTAPKSRVSSQGMGGVGKTMLTAAVVRDERVRGAFECIAWIGMSQQPDLLQLQAKLYQQLHPQNEVMPSKAISLDAGLRELTSLVSKRVVLVCLDDIWDSSHETSFACIDTDTTSRQLITTRIKGLLQGAAEVELELLGLQESVELLAGVACLDDAEISPVCLEIAQLCGRLPLCLSIIGNMIRTFGDGWQSEVPSLIRHDMGNLAEGGSSTGMNLQRRVIQSGLDSIGGEDRENKIKLFLAMGCYAEDQVVQVPIIGVLWASLGIQIQAGKLSALRLRQWVAELLSRSILLGSLADGISMHDIVRDFTLASHAPAEFMQLQRAFINSIFAHAAADQNSKATATVAAYMLRDLTSHFRAAITIPIPVNDAFVISAMVHSVDGINKGNPVQLQALTAIGFAEMATFAKQLKTEAGQCDYWTTARIFTAMGFLCESAKHGKETRCTYFRESLAALSHVSDSQPGAVALALENRGHLRVITSDKEEQAELFKKDEEMIDNDELFQQLPAFTQIMAITWSACAHIGALNGTYSTPRVPFDGAKKGAHRALRSSLELRQWLPESGMEGCMLANLVGNQFQAYSLMSIAYVCPTELAAAKQVLLGEGGSLVVQWFASYQLEWHATSVAINQDPWHGWCLQSILLLNYADFKQWTAICDSWEEIDKLAQASNSAITQSVFYTWPPMSSARLQQLYRRRNLTWANIERVVDAILPVSFQWENEHVFYSHKQTMHALMKAILALHIPEAVAPSELAEFLPPSWCEKFFADAFFEASAMGASLASLAARLCFLDGELGTSRRITAEALARHTNPVRLLHAYLDLACFANNSETRGEL